MEQIDRKQKIALKDRFACYIRVPYQMLKKMDWKRGILTVSFLIGILQIACGQPTVGNVQNPPAICSGNSLQLTVPTVSYGSEITITSQGWYLYDAVGAKWIPITASTLMYRSDDGSNLKYGVNWTSATQYGFQMNSNNAFISVYDVPAASGITISSTCVGNQLTPTVSPGSNRGSVLTGLKWVLDGNIISTTYNSAYTYNATDNGKPLYLGVSNGCGTTNSNTVTVTVNDSPSISMLTPPAEICAGAPLNLTTPTVNGNGLPITAQGWYLGGNAITGATIMTLSDHGKKLTYRATNACGTKEKQ